MLRVFEILTKHFTENEISLIFEAARGADTMYYECEIGDVIKSVRVEGYDDDRASILVEVYYYYGDASIKDVYEFHYLDGVVDIVDIRRDAR